MRPDNIVLATAKIHILKQFTTPLWQNPPPSLLCLLLQRYTFWSNSQPWGFRSEPNTYCACYCKDTHFEAIHNRTVTLTAVVTLCLLLQRYTFWSNSQLTVPCESFLSIVLATAKIHILKQFTTSEAAERRREGLCLLLQRYTFWSNSQRYFSNTVLLGYCACYCKDTHFEAIHNHVRLQNVTVRIVLATAKIHILKQFTTAKTEALIETALCLLLQRYTFWSNSQRIVRKIHECFDCACYCKDTHFEAIHNL